MLTEADPAAFVSESALGRLNNRLQQFNTVGFDQAPGVEDSETSFDIDTASLPTSEIVFYSPLSDWRHQARKDHHCASSFLRRRYRKAVLPSRIRTKSQR